MATKTHVSEAHVERVVAAVQAGQVPQVRRCRPKRSSWGAGRCAAKSP